MYELCEIQNLLSLERNLKETQKLMYDHEYRAVYILILSDHVVRHKRTEAFV